MRSVIARLLQDPGLDGACAGDGRGRHDAARRPRQPGAVGDHGRGRAADASGFRDGPESDLYIDAVFGTGLKRAPEGDLLELLRDLAVGATRCLRAAACGGGRALGSRPRQRADAGGWGRRAASASVPLCSLTVTFEVPKVGHVLADGPATCGQMAVVDLGLLKWRRDALTGVRGERGKPGRRAHGLIDLAADGRPPADRRATDRQTFRQAGRAQVRPRPRFDRLGPAGRTGAARLAARAALRIGAAW
jgi:hypothetical protein